MVDYHLLRVRRRTSTQSVPDIYSQHNYYSNGECKCQVYISQNAKNWQKLEYGQSKHIHISTLKKKKPLNVKISK